MEAIQTRPQTQITADQFAQVLLTRKTRRFGCGMTLPSGPVAYESQQRPHPLTRREEEYLIFSATGTSGLNLGDMQFQARPGHQDGQGMALMNLRSRTVPSACSAQTTRLFFTNDDGVYFVKAAAYQDGAPAIQTEKLQEGRLDIPRILPIMLSFNQWYTNRPGTTYFMPVTHVTELYLNLLMTVLSEEYGYFFIDTDNGGAACGLDAFRKSRGGHLHDDPTYGRVLTLRDLDEKISQLANHEASMMCHNIQLMETVLGLGGGIQSVGSGLHMLGIDPRVCRGLGFQFIYQTRRNTRPNSWGLPRLWESLVTPSTTRMDDAIETVFNAKFGPSGTYRHLMGKPWSHPELAQEVTPHSDASRAAAIALSNYVLKEYGRFPAHVDAFQLGLGCQAHHLDLDFYDHFYPNSIMPSAHREHRDTCTRHGLPESEVLS